MDLEISRCWKVGLSSRFEYRNTIAIAKDQIISPDMTLIWTRLVDDSSERSGVAYKKWSGKIGGMQIVS
jgi:hypothetical protein